MFLDNNRKYYVDRQNYKIFTTCKKFILSVMDCLDDI